MVERIPLRVKGFRSCELRTIAKDMYSHSVVNDLLFLHSCPCAKESKDSCDAALLL